MALRLVALRLADAMERVPNAPLSSDAKRLLGAVLDECRNHTAPHSMPSIRFGHDTDIEGANAALREAAEKTFRPDSRDLAKRLATCACRWRPKAPAKTDAERRRQLFDMGLSVIVSMGALAVTIELSGGDAAEALRPMTDEEFAAAGGPPSP